MSKGEVIEQGNHQALIANESGHYTTLVKLQMKEEMEKGGLEKTDTAVPDPDAVLIEEDVDGEEEAARGDGKAAGAGKRGSKELAMSPAGSGQLPASVGVAVGGRRVSAEAAAMRRGGSAAAVDIEAAIPEANKDKQGGKDKKEKQASVGFSRLLEYNRPEWYFFILGGIGAAAAGVVQPAFAFVISAMINTFYLVRFWGSGRRGGLGMCDKVNVGHALVNCAFCCLYTFVILATINTIYLVCFGGQRLACGVHGMVSCSMYGRASS